MPAVVAKPWRFDNGERNIGRPQHIPVLVKKKIRWEINRAPLKAAGMGISSQLLRNAVRIVDIPRDQRKRSMSEDGSEPGGGDVRVPTHYAETAWLSEHQ